jgi:hypothetical protein
LRYVCVCVCGVAEYRKLIKQDSPRVNASDLHLRSTYVRFEVLTAVTRKNAVFWDVAPCISCVNRRFGGTYRLHLQVREIRERGTSVRMWLQTESPVEKHSAI